MNTYNCPNCGCPIHEHSGDKCICQACGSELSIAELEKRSAFTEQLNKRIKDEVYADERNKRKREESDAERYAEKNRNESRQEEANIKLTEAEEALRRAEIRRANAEAANAGKAKTIILNGPDATMLGENAVRAFVAKDFQTAFKAATEVLATDKDHIGACFITSFKSYVVDHNRAGMNGFIQRITSSDYAVLDSDQSMLQDLMATAPTKLMDFEEQILSFVYNNSVGDPAKEEATCKFVDSFSPPIINSRSDHSFMTPNMVWLYRNLAAYCTIPKTCHALICSINSNPESPVKNGRYYLKSVSKKFYDEYVLPINDIIGSMKSEKYRSQFSKGYEQYRSSYQQKAGI